MARGAGRGNYSMETIILNIFVKRGGGGDYSGGRRFVEGLLLFVEIRYL